MKFKKAANNNPEIDMTSMIDMTFQLIAFFMIITNFENTRADERVKLPRDELAKPLEAPREDELVLNIGYERDKDGQIVSEPLLFYGDGQSYAVSEIEPILQRESKYFSDLGKKPGEATVIIRADSEVPTGMVQEVIKDCQAAKFEKFALKATQEAL